MTELKKLIGDNATEEEVMLALEKVCSILPKTVVEACTSFVDVYGKAIIELLLQELDPEQVCTQIGLCGSAAKLPVSSATTTVAPRPVVGETEQCVVCETIIQYLEALMEQNATEVEIEMILERICNYLPNPMATSCENFVKQYGDLIIQYITTFASPKEVCSLMGVCSNKGSARVKATQDVKAGQGAHEEMEVAKKAPMLGQNECSWGPAYWCASRENADKCNAVDHCKKKVWNQ
jgi:saposin